jgi:glucokinase
MPFLLALDFGGTKHSAGLVEWPLDGKHPLDWKAHDRIFVPPGVNSQIDIEIILKLAYGLMLGEAPAAVGVSFGGPVNAATNSVILSHHVKGWENIPLGQLLQSQFGCPVCVENDANVAALGEQRFGAGRGCRCMVYMTVSTGVGGGLILDDKIWHGLDSMAGEIGHTVIDPRGPVCLCGKRGCVERYASGRYLAEDARQSLSENKIQSPTLMNLAGGNLSAITGQMVSQAAEQGDPMAIELIDRAAWALGTGIGNLANLINPERFVLGGGVTKSGGRFWQMLRQTARQVALPELSLNIQPAALDDDAPLWGAVVLAGLCL